MRVHDSDGTVLTDPLDLLCILKRQDTGRFHVCFAEEHPLPGPILPADQTDYVRLKSGMHHTDGADTLPEARQQLVEMRKRLIIQDDNVFAEEAVEVEDAVFVVLVPNWTKGARGQNPLIGRLGPVVQPT